MAEVDPVRAEYRRRIVEIYEAHAADRVSTVDGLLDKYKGKEHTLYMKICKKYHEPTMARFKAPIIVEEEPEEESEEEVEGDESSEEEEEEDDDEQQEEADLPCAWKLILKQSKAGFDGDAFKGGDVPLSENSFANVSPDYIKSFRNGKKQYRFKLKFPTLKDDRPNDFKIGDNDEVLNEIIWTQKSNINENTVEGFEQVVNDYGEAFNGLCVDKTEGRSSMFTSPSGDLRVGMWELSENDALCGPLDTDWGEPLDVYNVELYVMVPPIICMPLGTTTKNVVGKHVGEAEGSAKIQFGCLNFPKDDDHKCVTISNDKQLFRWTAEFSACMFFQKHFKQSEGACLVSKGNRDTGFMLKIEERLDGDYIKAQARTGQGISRVNCKYRDKSEWDILQDKELNKFHDEAPNLNWTHVCMTLGDRKLKLYINGKMVAEKKASSMLINTKDITLGAENGEKPHLKGRIFDFNVFGQCLDEAAILSIMNDGAKRIPSIDEAVKASVVVKEVKASKSQLSQQERIRRKMAARMAKRKQQEQEKEQEEEESSDW